jgi:hypothetical protein
MTHGSSPSAGGPGARVELWLLRPGSAAELARRLQDFAGTDLARVLAPEAGAEARWAAAFARARGSELLTLAALGPRQAGESPEDAAERVWSALEHGLGRGAPRCLALLELEALRLGVARGLGFPPESAGNLRVDPGRGVLLAREELGLVLCRSNVSGPAPRTGSPLPGLARGERP